MNISHLRYQSSGRLVGGLLLVAGTCMGGGMLGLPVETGQAGFFPSLIIYLMAWGLMTITGLFMLEVLASLKKEVNLVSMASTTLGRLGEIIAWVLYLFLFFSLVVAYSKAIIDLVSTIVPHIYAVIIFLVFLIGTIQLGTKFVARLNSMLVVGLFISYGGLVALGIPHVEFARLGVTHWQASLPALPLVITAFGFQGVVPIVYRYFGGNYRQVRKAILWGSLLSLTVYVSWQVLVLGAVPIEGPHGLKAARIQDKLATWSLEGQLNDLRISAISQGLAFFAITSSLLGVGIGLVDFLLDGFHIKKLWKNRFLATCLTFAPATLIATQSVTVFYSALTYGGGLGCTLLLGALPTAMVWTLRRQKEARYEYRVAGSYATLTLIIALVLLAVGSIVTSWID